MPRIVAAAHAFPPNDVTQSQIKELIERAFAGRIDNLPEKLEVYDHARIESRHLVRSPEWYLEDRTASESNRVYQHEGAILLAQAAKNSLQKAGLVPDEIEHVICVSTTGLATPSMESRIFAEIGLPSRTRRTPIWGLGCAAGAVGLSRADEYCRAFPRAKVLVLALELCSLTFQRQDVSQKNLIGTALFGDGAAATVIVGDAVTKSGPAILATRSHLFAGTERIMGWDINDDGMQLVLSPKLPALVLKEMQPLAKSFLGENGLSLQDIEYFLMHPGGAKVLDAYRQALHLKEGDLKLSEESLRRHGNISSVSILLVLEQWLAKQAELKPGIGLMAAFGPGFAAEMLLLES